MRVASAASPDNVEMTSIFSALKAAAKKILLGSFIVAGLTFGVLSMMARVYQSDAELAIMAKGQPSSFADSRSQSTVDSIATKMDQQAINTHVRALQSSDLLAQVADELKLHEKREFNAKLGPVDMLDTVGRMIGLGGARPGESERDSVLGALRDRLQVFAAKDSRFVVVRAQSIEPQTAADIANRIADNYRKSLATHGVSEIDDQQEVLQAKIDKISPELVALETEVDQYRGKINAFKGGAQNTGLTEQQLSELTAELTRANAARAEADARALSAREMMKTGSADALPDVQKNPLIQNLVEQRVRIERQISELSATLLPAHPRMRQLNADLAGLKTQLRGETSKVVDSLVKEARVARGRESSIQDSLNALKTKLVSNAPEVAKLRQLEANAKAKRTELENLQAQIEANRKKLDTRAQPVEAQLVSTASAGSVPIFPKKGSMSALALVASLLFGSAWTVTKALFVGARTPPSGAAAIAGHVRAPATPELSGYVPNAQPEAPSAKPVASSEAPLAAAAATPVAAAPVPTVAGPVGEIAALASRLDAARSEGRGHRCLLTGLSPAIDSNNEAIELAKALSALGRHVVLADWSPTGGGVAEKLQLAVEPGMTDLIIGETSFDQAIARMPGCGAHIIPTGRSLDAVAAELDPDQLNLVLDALDEAYDHIIVTGPHEDARALFEAIQGRFDTGITVAESQGRVSVLDDPEDTFLGFEVAEIELIRYVRPLATSGLVQQRLMRAMPRNGDGGGRNAPLPH